MGGGGALFVFSLLTHLVVLYTTEEGELYNKRCPAIPCNDKVGHIQFPLRNKTHPPECGGLFTVDCSDHNHPKIQLKKEGYWHEVESIPVPNMISIDDSDLRQRLESDSCNDQLFNDLSLPSASPIFDASLTYNLTLVKCNTTIPTLHNTDLKYHCKNDNHTYYITWSDDSLPSFPPSCSIIQIPSLDSNQPPPRFPSLSTMFYLQLPVSEACKRCHDRKGECLDDKGKFKCSVGEKGDKLGLKLGPRY